MAPEEEAGVSSEVPSDGALPAAAAEEEEEAAEEEPGVHSEDTKSAPAEPSTAPANSQLLHQPVFRLNEDVTREIMGMVQEFLCFYNFPLAAQALAEENTAKQAMGSISQRLDLNKQRLRGELVSMACHACNTHARPCNTRRVLPCHHVSVDTMSSALYKHTHKRVTHAH